MFDAAIEVGSFGGKTEREIKNKNTEIEMVIENRIKRKKEVEQTERVVKEES